MNGAAEIARQHVAKPLEVLHVKRLIKSELGAKGCDTLRCRGIGQNQYRKIAWQKRNQKERDQRDREERSYDAETAERQSADQHFNVARFRTVGPTRPASPRNLAPSCL